MCIDESIELVKISMYRHITIMVNNLIISFHQRKSYRIYICEDFILVVAGTQNQVTDEFKLAFDKHVEEIKLCVSTEKMVGIIKVALWCTWTKIYCLLKV